MKRLAFWIMTMALPAALLAQDDNNFSITGVEKDGSVREVYLTYYSAHGLRTDSARIIDHAYTLSGKTPEGLVASLSSVGPDDFPTPDRLASVFLMPSEHFRVTHGNTFSDIVVTGSPANTEYEKLMQLSKAYHAAQAAPSAEGEREEVYGRYMRENPHSPLQGFAFSNYVGNLGWITSQDVPKVRTYLDLFSDSMRNTAALLAVAHQLENKETFENTVAVGRPAPDFTQNDTTGHPVSLSSFRGKYVLVDFWASWCGPCRQENPTVVAAYQKFHGKGFEIIGVSLDQDEKLWKKAIRADKLTWTHVSDLKYWNNAVAKVYGVQGVPQNFLIDPQGKIIARGLRGEELDKQLSEIYKN